MARTFLRPLQATIAVALACTILPLRLPAQGQGLASAEGNAGTRPGGTSVSPAGGVTRLGGEAGAPVSKTESSENARKARQAYEAGLRAEKIGDWDRALALYRIAADQSPQDKTIRLRREVARAEAASMRTAQAEREILSSQKESARASLRAALQIDPSYTAASERLRQISAAIPSSPSPASSSIPGQDALDGPRLLGPAPLHAQAGLRSFDYRGTTRGAYEEIARQFGLVAAFDAELVDRQIQFRVADLDFTTALRVLGEETGTFWRTVNSGTFFVAADTPAKRGEYDPEVKKTIELPTSETNDEMTETTRLVREIVGVRRSDLDMKSHTLTVRDTAQNVALAEALVKEVEQPHGEALLDIDILEVDRTLARSMGLTPPNKVQAFTFSSAQVTELEQAPNIGTLNQILQSIFGAQNPLAASGGAASVVPPLIAFGGGKTLFLATLPNLSGGLSEALSVVRRAQRVLLRVEDGRPATFFVGEHFPITLALLSESLVVPATQFSNAVPAGSFPRTDYGVGTSPSGVTVGSFNGDANLDLAVANQAANTVSILPGNGDGTFGARSDFATGAGPAAVVAGDFNKDGKQDLAVVNHTDNTVSILLGNGDGAFATHTDIPVGAGPIALVAADFNRDGNLDLAVANQTANTISILLGNGDGTFKPKQDYAVGTTPVAVTLGDFNNDGNIDLAVANHAANTFSMLLGKGDGTFLTRTDFGTRAGPSSIASADFNVDGRLDLVVTNQTDNTLSLFLGNGDGTFHSATDFATGNGPSAVLAADFNVDGFPDVVVANQTDNTVSVFLGLGNGTLLTPFALSTGNGPVALAQGDLTTATLPDLVVANQSSDSISVILNSSNVSVTPNAPLTSYPGSEYVDLGLKVHATPRLHPNHEVTLDLQFDISAVSGQNVNGIPVLTNRTIAQSVRLRDDQTSVLSGIIQRSDVRSVNGWPGLGEAGPVGYLFGVHGKQESDTELLIAITPRQLRLAARTDTTFYAGRGTGSAPVGLPPNVPPPGTPGVPVPGAPVPGAPAPGALAPGAAPPGAPAPGAPPQGTPPAPPVLPAPGTPATPTQPPPGPAGAPSQPPPGTPGPSN